MMSVLPMPRIRRRLNHRRQLEFLVDFSQWLADGQAPDAALAGMELLAKERKDRHQYQVIKQLRSALAQGKPVAVGMQNDFSKELQVLVDIGQRAGCLPELIARHQVFNDRRRQLLKRVGQGLTYPLVLLLAAIIAVAFIGAVVLPKFQSIDTLSGLPLFSGMLQTLGIAIVQVGPLVILTIVLSIPLMVIGLPRYRKRLPHHFQNIFILTVINAYHAIYLLQGLSLFLACNISLEHSLRLFEARCSSYLREHVKAMRKSLGRGETRMPKVFATGLLNPAVLYRMEVGAATRQSKRILFAHLADRIMLDTERLVITRQRTMAYLCYSVAILLILLIIFGLGQLFTELAQQWA
ncbi:type II secretion system F family protein [Aliidiomarina iranensis]|nr:type II secretion system F family protein [Aliidiomarina iranensis]